VLRPVLPHRLTNLSGDLLRRLAGVGSLALLAALPAFAQQPPAGNTPAAPSAAAAAEPPAGTTAVDDAPALDDAAVPPAAGAGAPGRTAAAAGGAADLGDTAGATPQPTAAGPQLPPDWKPPAPTPEEMTLHKPTLTQEEINKQEGALRRLNVGGAFGIDAVIRNGDLNPATQKALNDWANLQIAKLAVLNMSSQEDRQKFGGLVRNIMLSIRSAGMAQSNPNRQRDFRKAVCDAMAKACENVLLDNNFYVRMGAATILSQLNEREEPPTGPRQPPIAYVPAMKPLLDVLADPKQPEAVRVVAAKGVGRIAENAESIDAELRYRAGDILTKAIADPNTFPWYQMRLAEALAAIELDVDRNRQPIVLNALMQVIADDKRPCLARSAAAKALGRIPLPAGAWNDAAAADALTKLAHDMAIKYNKDPNEVVWYDCFVNLYLTAKTAPNEDVSRLPTSSLLRKGTLTGPLDDFYKQFLPVAQHVVNQPPGGNHKPIPTEAIQRLQPKVPVNTETK
jgi:hypothetical protein